MLSSCPHISADVMVVNMASIFVIEDDLHAELCGEFATFEAALEELRRRAGIPWNVPPNQCPCTSWRTCARDYVVIEYNNASVPWRQVKTTPALAVSADGAHWDIDV